MTPRLDATFVEEMGPAEREAHHAAHRVVGAPPELLQLPRGWVLGDGRDIHDNPRATADLLWRYTISDVEVEGEVEAICKHGACGRVRVGVRVVAVDEAGDLKIRFDDAIIDYEGEWYGLNIPMDVSQPTTGTSIRIRDAFWNETEDILIDRTGFPLPFSTLQR